ncbi:hypothetical protein [Pusillimonas sp. ANT_WB101]|uniref:hypothetical protein n=1 Tax=Pusillimonas sp. ANT_WB101 TaxID=2597356 RepID=UPI0011ED64B9|nr:hypothetical protein [Pusillimonas sp. ANT_WB101]KAA0910805.1 hypothetical protein FQ179_02720 [Pusillimonas sp. ANT_WB101]
MNEPHKTKRHGRPPSANNPNHASKVRRQKEILLEIQLQSGKTASQLERELCGGANYEDGNAGKKWRRWASGTLCTSLGKIIEKAEKKGYFSERARQIARANVNDSKFLNETLPKCIKHESARVALEKALRDFECLIEGTLASDDAHMLKVPLTSEEKDEQDLLDFEHDVDGTEYALLHLKPVDAPSLRAMLSDVKKLTEVCLYPAKPRVKDPSKTNGYFDFYN